MSLEERTLSRYCMMSRHVARTIMRNLSDVDSLACGVDDYTQELVVQALKAAAKWDEDPDKVAQGDEAKRKYVCRAIWQQGRWFVNRRSYQRYDAVTVPIMDDSDFLRDSSFERQMEDRDLLRKVRSLCTAAQWSSIEMRAEGVYTRHARRVASLVREKAEKRIA